MNETQVYENNISVFASSLQGKYLKRILFEIDSHPTFEQTTLPFSFRYCNSIFLETEEGIHRIITALNSEAFETFWTSSERSDSCNFQEAFEVNACIKEILVKRKYKFAYWIHFKFDSQDLVLIAADIHNSNDGKLDYKIPDEMVLAFRDVESARMFERLAGCG